MGKVEDEFARVLGKHAGISVVQTIHMLEQRCPNDVTFTTTLRKNDDEASYYYCEVLISNKSSYVASSICKQTAEENSATMAYNFLKNNVDLKRSQRLSVDNQDNRIKEDILSKEVLATIGTLKKCGFSVDIFDHPMMDSSSFGLKYYVSFKIPGVGEFAAISESRLSAFEEASEKFLSAYDEDFSLKLCKARDLRSDSQNTTLSPTRSASPALSQHTACSSTSSVLELIGFEGPIDGSSTLEPAEYISNSSGPPKRLLTLVDNMWIDLIKRFNEANLSTRSVTEVIGELVTTELMQYKLEAEKFFSKDGKTQNRYKTRLNFANHSITSKDLTADDSQLKTYTKAYRLMEKLSALLLAVKHVYSSTKSSLEIKSKVPKDYMSIIVESAKNLPASGTFYANVRLADHMFFHEATSDNETEALAVVYSRLFNYLNLMADYIYEKPSIVSSQPSPDSSFIKTPQSLISVTTAAPSCSSHSSTSAQSTSGSSSSLGNAQSQMDPFSNEALSKAVLTLQPGPQPFLPITRNISVAVNKLAPLAQLISHFNQVYQVDLSRVEIINQLSEKRQWGCLVESNKKHFVCQLKVPELGTLYGASLAIYEAYQNTLKQAFDMLHNFSSIISSFKLIRSANLSPDIIMETFLALNAKLISTKTWPISSHKHQTCFTIESFHVRFEDEGNSANESQWRAFNWLFHFMDQLCGLVSGSITFNKPAHHQSEEVVNPLAAKIANRLPIQVRKPDTLMPSESIKVMELIYRFYQIYSVNEGRAAAEVIGELTNTVKNLIGRKTKRDYDQKGNLRYQTVLNVSHLGSFTTTEATRESSKNEAFRMLYNRLFKLYRLTQKIFRVSPNDQQAILDKVPKWCIKYPELLKCVVNERSGTVALVMTNFNTFRATGKDYEDALKNAFYKLSGALSRLKEEAINAANMEDNAALEALRVQTALAMDSSSYKMDASIAARIKLLIDFLTFYSPAKDAITIVNEMIAKNDSIAFIRKSSTSNGLAAEAIATIAVTDVGEFHHCAKSSSAAMGECATQLFNFLARLSNLLNDFNRVYDSTKPASMVITQLLHKGHIHLIKVYQIKLNNAQGDVNLSYLSVVWLNRMRSFGRVAETLENAFCDASTHAIAYLKKLSEGVQSQFNAKTWIDIEEKA